MASSLPYRDLGGMGALNVEGDDFSQVQRPTTSWREGPPQRDVPPQGDGQRAPALVLGHAKQSLCMQFDLLPHYHHSSIVGHSPDQPTRASSERP